MIVSACIIHAHGKSTLAYETVRKGYSEKRKSHRKERKKQIFLYTFMNVVHVPLHVYGKCTCTLPAELLQ